MTPWQVASSKASSPPGQLVRGQGSPIVPFSRSDARIERLPRISPQIPEGSMLLPLLPVSVKKVIDRRNVSGPDCFLRCFGCVSGAF